MRPQSTIEDPYKVLGVERNATEDQIRDAYKSKIKISHPDVGGNEEECKRLNSAKDLLLDPQERAAFNAGGVRMSAGDPMAAFFARFGGMGGFRFTGGQGGATFSFHSQRVINVEASMTIADFLFGNKQFKISSAAGEVVIELPAQMQPGQSFNVLLKRDASEEVVLRVRMALRMPTKELNPEQEKLIREIQ